MPLVDYRNPNSLWASVAVATLVKLGLKTAVVCPGSRSTPLTYALAVHPEVDAVPILDERSAAFFALGWAKQQGQPVALVCTSGTAGANFYPAVIEAYESQVPLLVMTADRPPELRDCGAGQAIDQQKLFGKFVVAETELAVPEAKETLLTYLRQTLVTLWTRAQHPQPGPVHINCPFRDPLPPVPVEPPLALRLKGGFFAGVQPFERPVVQGMVPWEAWLGCDRPLIIAGPAQPKDPAAYCKTVSHLAQTLGCPILTEALSPLRNYSGINNRITTYDTILRSPEQAKRLQPNCIIQLGPLPTSKVLRQWLEQFPHQRWVITKSGRNLDPTHGQAQQLPIQIWALSRSQGTVGDTGTVETAAENAYTQDWQAAEVRTRELLDEAIQKTNHLFEGKAVWLLSQHLPQNTPIFIANSMPVRDAESFWQPNHDHYRIFFSRGTNGIDGTLSTALGTVHANNPGVLLTGDLAFLHDTNGLLASQHLRGHLTVVLINNKGGGIFNMLPIAQFNPPFETYFATPQKVDIATLCKAHEVGHDLIQSWSQFVQLVSKLPSQGLRVLEIPTDRAADAQFRSQLFSQLAASLSDKIPATDSQAPPPGSSPPASSTRAANRPQPPAPRAD